MSGLTRLAALALVALIGVGCSNGPAETGTSHSADPHEQAVKFAQCMRDNGVSEFPDPDADGSLTLDEVVNGSSIDTSSAAWKDAHGACKDLEPAGFTGHQRSAQQQAAALKFAQCIREHGVADFPDPGPDDPLVDTNKIPSANGNGGMDILNAAMRTCGEIFADQMGIGNQ